MRDATTHEHAPKDDHLTAADHEARTWDDFYDRDGPPRWSGRPNGNVIVEVAGLTPGRALDVGCGEGADAVWLAQRGWVVTALDPSAVALDRARRTAAEADTRVTWLRGGLVELADELGVFDLVSIQYGVLPLDPEVGAIRSLCNVVAPGGTLLVVHHEMEPDHPGTRAFDTVGHVLPDDVIAQLGEDWRIETHERRHRPGPLPPETPRVRDIVLRACRLDGGPDT